MKTGNERFFSLCVSVLHLKTEEGKGKRKERKQVKWKPEYGSQKIRCFFAESHIEPATCEGRVSEAKDKAKESKGKQQNSRD